MVRCQCLGDEGADRHSLLPCGLVDAHSLREGSPARLRARAEAPFPKVHQQPDVSLRQVVLGGQARHVTKRQQAVELPVDALVQPLDVRVAEAQQPVGCQLSEPCPDAVLGSCVLQSLRSQGVFVDGHESIPEPLRLHRAVHLGHLVRLPEQVHPAVFDRAAVELGAAEDEPMVGDAAATCALTIGCDGGSGVDGDAAVDAAPGGDLPSCIEACTAKAAECGAPADAAALECEGLCRGGSSPTQVDCLRRTSCEELVGAFSTGGELCGLGGSVVPDGGPPDGGPPDRGPGACTIGDRRCPEDYVAFRCEELAGRPLQVTEDCPSPRQPCENGWCVDPSRPGLQSTCGSASDCRTPAR